LHGSKLKAVGRYALLSMNGLPPIEQGAIVTKAGAANPHAAGFIRFLGSPEGRAILARNGFSLPVSAAE
jgi:molybdate transport system substrate-binding protein